MLTVARSMTPTPLSSMPKPVAYLAGPMSGYPNYNFDKFNRLAGKLREAGWSIVNPAETAGGAADLGRPWYFKYDFSVILNCCDAVICMEDWDTSAGAKAELVVAHESGLPIYEIDDEGCFVGEVTVKGLTVDFEVRDTEDALVRGS
jgi:hypothetical protein